MHEKFTLIQKHDLEATPSYFTSRALEIMFKFKIYKSGYVIIFFCAVIIAGVANLFFTHDRLF